jgi:hypothetical protein
VAERELADPGPERLGEVLRDRLVHEEPVCRSTGLAHVAHLGHHRARDGGVDVGVLEDQERGVAPDEEPTRLHEPSPGPRTAGLVAKAKLRMKLTLPRRQSA